MRITLDIPEELAARIIPDGKDLSQVVLEAMAVDGYRTRRLTEGQVRRMLGYGTRLQVHALLKEYDVYLDYTLDNLQQDIAASDTFLAERTQQATLAR